MQQIPGLLRRTCALGLLALLASACGSSSGGEVVGGVPLADSVSAAADGGAPATDAGSSPVDSDPGGPGPSPAKPKPYHAGSCPTLKTGQNEIKAGGAVRAFRLYLPPQPKGAPLVMLWHGLGDSSGNFASSMGAAFIATQRGAVVVVPQAKAPSAGATAIWQFPSPLANKPPQFDLLLFDSLLTCIDQQFDIDNGRVATMGFSAGAIWSTYLVMHRSDFLATAAIFSGGISTSLFPYKKPSYKVPVIGAHGGPSDDFQGLFKFADMMTTLSTNLTNDGHVMVLCAHGQGHTITQAVVAGAVEFVFTHKFDDGSSIYDATRVEKLLPSYCALQ